MTSGYDEIPAYLESHPWFAPHVLAAQNPCGWPLAARTTLPPAQELADELLADAGFRALKLGTWLGTPDGQLISEAVARMIPPGYQPVFSLTVDALQLAAQQQAEEGRRQAGAIALVALGAGVIIAIGRRP
jgi:hypothetical protein